MTCKLSLGKYVPIRPNINVRVCDIAFLCVKYVLYVCHEMRGLTKYPRRALHLSGLDTRVGGVHFWPSPFWPLGDFFWFFWLNLGSTSPNYSRRPPMRSSKAPPNQENRGQLLPHPTEPSLRAWQVQRSLGVFRHFLRWAGTHLKT